MKKLKVLAGKAGNVVKGAAGKAAAAGSALVASGAAFATSSTPGSAIAGELSSGKSEVMLVVAAVAVIIGVLLLWSYIKRAK